MMYASFSSGTPISSRAQDKQHFRRTLGQYPTGVTLITALEGAEPIGMVVGTFTSVSLDPPLVGFLIDRNSRTWPRIAATGRFAANVLGADQLDVCRAFAQKEPDPFSSRPWTPSPSGSPILGGVCAWVDCVVTEVIDAGDHVMVLSSVVDLDSSVDSNAPLIFLRGGYGAPYLPSLHAAGAGLGEQLRVADALQPELERISAEYEKPCILTAAVGADVVVVSACGVMTPIGTQASIGVTFPLAAPLSPIIMSTGTSEQLDAWIRRGASLTSFDEESARSAVARVRDLGYGVHHHGAHTYEFNRTIFGQPALSPQDAVTLAAARQADPLDILDGALENVASLHIPVKSVNGAQCAIAMLGFDGTESPEAMAVILQQLLGAARAVSTAA